MDEFGVVLRRDMCRYTNNPAGFLVKSIKNLYSHPAFAGVVFYRIGRWLWLRRSNPAFRVAYMLTRLIYPLVRWHSGVELQARTQIGPGLCLMHFGPIVIHPDVVAGEDLTILPGVTIGEDNRGTPVIGDRVAVGAGVLIIGRVSVGNDVNIGAGAVVVKDLPAHCTAVGVPAKPLERPLSDARPAELRVDTTPSSL